MKRRYRMRTLVIILTIASFLLLNSCGIPTYLYLDNNAMSLTKEETIVGTYDLTLTLTNEAYDDLLEKKTTPSIKLFYAYSTNNTVGAMQSTQSIISLDKARTSFNSLYRKDNRGVAFSVGANSAPALYLYRKDPSSTSISSSIDKFTYLEDQETDALVLSTFSTRAAYAANDDDYMFNGAPLMDFTLPMNAATFTSTISGKTATFKIAFDTTGEFSQITLTTPVDGNFDLGDYQKMRFLGKTSTKEAFRDHLGDQDGDTFEFLIDELAAVGPSLYIHIWASLFGGDGDFNNIVWSELKYIDAIQLL